MDNFQTFIFFMFAAAIIVGISQKIKIPYPIGLVLGGLLLGFIPLKHEILSNPNIILDIVLPPILYYGAFGIAIREFKRNIKDILSLALGLVIFNTLIIGILFHWIFPQYSWALAFAFGAIVSPPDAIAATAILKRFHISNRLETILEGESLINDASAIVLYRLALTALLSGTFSFSEASINFLQIASGGLVVGGIMGYLTQNFSRHYLDPVVGVVFSFTIPYITYFLAIALNVSGVLAVVANGLIGSQILLRHHSSLRRIVGYASWDIFIILMNCFVFIMIGFQLQTLTKKLSYQDMILYTGYAIFITLAMLVIRMLWVYAKSARSYLRTYNKEPTSSNCKQILRESAVMGWAGMRGIVSLAAALALPYTLSNGMPLEGRNEVIFITFIVILLTLLIPGLTLSTLIRWLHMPNISEHYDLGHVKSQLTEIAEKTIEKLYLHNKISTHERDFLKSHFQLQLRLAKLSSAEQIKLQNFESAKSQIIQEQRKKLFELWEEQEIDDKILRDLEQELDLEEIHIARAEIK